MWRLLVLMFSFHMQIQRTLNELDMLIPALKATLLEKLFFHLSVSFCYVLNVFRHKNLISQGVSFTKFSPQISML